MKLTTSYDVIVVGAGVMGSAAAYHLAGDGRQVLLLEQFQIGHTRGSSHGGSRIIRYTHAEIDFARLMPATFARWRQLEAESGEALLQMSGGLFMGPPDEAFLCEAQTTHQTLHHPYQVLTQAELSDRFPQFRLPAGWVALYQPDAGILAATRCVQTLARQASRRGADVREGTQVLRVEPSGEGVAVHCSGPAGAETLYARQVVISAGPWAQRLLAPLVSFPLPLQVTHQQLAYFPVEQPDLYAVERCPVYVFTAEPHFYGFPIYEQQGHVKVGQETINTTVNPDGPRMVDQENLRALCDTIGRTLVGVRPEPSHVDLCLYTETPNRDFIIDRHPDYPQILLAAGFSGRGFKFGIAVGRLVADLAATPPGSYASEFWLPRFALTRFAPAAQ